MASPFHRVFDGATGEGGLPWEAETGGVTWIPRMMPGTFFLGDASQVVLVGSDVDILEDQVATGTPTGDQDLTAPAAGQRPAFSASDARLGGQNCLDFVAASNDILAGATAANWNCLHNGTGGSFAIVLYRDIVATMGWATTGNGATGFGLTHAASATLLWRVFSGATEVVNSTAVAMTTGAPHVVIVRYKEGQAPAEASLRIDGVSMYAGDSLAAPSAADANHALYVGSIASSVIPADGAVGHVQAASVFWTDAECQQLERYLTRYGVTLP